MSAFSGYMLNVQGCAMATYMRVLRVNHNSPRKQLRHLSQVMANPTIQSIRSLTENGEKATWEHIDVIERNTKISETLRYYLSALKRREAQESGHAEPFVCMR